MKKEESEKKLKQVEKIVLCAYTKNEKAALKF